MIMTMIYTYIAVNQDQRILEVDYARVVPNDALWVRMNNDGADAVLTWGVDVPVSDWRDDDRDIELVVAQNVARMHFTTNGRLSMVERPRIAIIEKASGKWGATCNDCGRAVCKPMMAQHLPIVIESGMQHRRMSH